ncbi:MAG: DUF1553 domain-containing protein [Verrucomicrobia bacterium]|nr:DUF1553 domain-containing protein [Verrucomicrobiota bacterium]
MINQIRSASLLLLGVGGILFTPCAQAAETTTEFSDQERKHWAFQPVVRQEPPKTRNAAWIKNPIDAFVLAELEAKQLQPAPAADKTTLLRRAALDLIGLPPSPEEVDAFLADRSPKAWEHAIERLLSSPHYGERWARHWLDLARYAESEGFKADETRPNAWRYRDYVIKSFNDDKPYDRFVQEQLAGDELWPEEPDARVATAFNRHYPDESNARNLVQRRQEILNDITDTVGSVFTGLTYGCARCHDHKFDPIRQVDYYRLQAFFANTAADDNIPLVAPAALNAYRAKLAVWEETTRAIREEMAAIEKPKRDDLIKDYVDKYPDEIQAALKKSASDRSPFERQMVAKAMLYLNPDSHQYLAPTSAVVAKLKGDDKQRWEELNAELEKFEPLHPGKLPSGTAMVDLSDQAPDTHLLRRGVYDAPQQEVEPGFLSILDPNPAKVCPPPGVNSTGRRAALANILTDPKNPLTARVRVNRIWHYHFGRGLVGTPSDFGVKGDPPTHPALLDWLASEFVRQGWSVKAIHRLILTSNTYRQSTRFNPAAAKIDPDNKLLWRFPRQRLEGEVIRDAALTVSGLLNPKMGGPSVFPELPAGAIGSYGGWKKDESESNQARRSIYVFAKRNVRYPLFESFDAPDTHESCARRNVTTTPIQALNLLNSDVSLKWAQSFASRVRCLAGPDRDAQIETAFRLAYSRPPDKVEKQTVKKFFERQRPIVAQRLAAGEEPPKPASTTGRADPADAVALVDLCHMLINANEFVYRN